MISLCITCFQLDQHANITSNSMFHPSKSIELSAVFRVLFCNTCVIDERFVAVVVVFFGYVNCATWYMNNFIRCLAAKRVGK
jgi:hypothetical protein